MKRNAFTDPQQGDVVHHPIFGGGCAFIVKDVFARKGWEGQAVMVELWMDDGHHVRPRQRIYSGKSWAAWDGEARFIGSLPNDCAGADHA